jgi:acetyl-CoA carboxylase carboxyltransferase component
VIEGVCAGVAAVAASMFDIVLTVKDKTQMYVTSPFILGENTATAEAAAASGLAAAVCGCEKCAAAKVRELIELLPQNNCDRACAGAEDPNRAIAPDAQLPGALLDGGVMSELYADFAPEMMVALGRMGGETVGVVYAHGALTVDAARKATKFISFCDCFGITILTLVDSEGVSVDEAAQSAPAAAVFGKLASAYANASCAKITVTVGKAYGSAYTLLGSKALGADVAFALPSAVISTMAPDKAVAFVWNDKVTNETSREDVEKEWIETYATPEKAAANGDIDDVIAPEELRARLCSAIYMLAAKTNGALTRKHGALPL